MSYVRYSKEQIESALPADWTVTNDPGWEYVYGWTSKNGNWQIKCYSGVDKRTNTSREKGADAIRFALIDAVSDRGVGKVERIHRTGSVQTLRDRMTNRFDRLRALAAEEAAHRCKKCGAATMERKSKAGNTFRGCIRWRECNDAIRKAEQARQPVLDLLRGDGQDSDVPQGAQVVSQADTAETRNQPQLLHAKGDGDTSLSSAFPYLRFPFERFNPVQSRAISVVADDVNLVVASPTSSGKTVIAEMAIAVALAHGKKGVFTSPLKALTQEKLDTWSTQWKWDGQPSVKGQKPFAFQGRHIEIVTGDYQLTEKRVNDLMAADLILMTSEMLDSRTRRMEKERNVWLYDVGCLVVDEAHMITMEERGHPIEAGIMRFTKQNPQARVVLLSATMPNVEDLGQWLTHLNGKRSVIVKSDWRPVPHAVNYVAHEDRGHYQQVERAKVGQVIETIRNNPDDKIIVFVHTKATGRMVLQVLYDELGIEAEFHSADLSKGERLRIEAAFRER